MIRLRDAVLAGLLLGGSVLRAEAQDTPFLMDQGAFANWAALGPMQERLEASHETLFGSSVAQSLSSAGEAGSGGPTIFAPVGAAGDRSVIRQLSAAYPAASRAAAEGVFKQLLAGFKQIEKTFGLRSNDVATAAAALIVGSYSAYNDVDVPDAQFVTVVKQMREIIGGTPAFGQASSAEKQETYNQLAILGTFMAVTRMALDQSPDPAISREARRAAGGYLQAFLNVDPERVRISNQGMEIR